MFGKANLDIFQATFHALFMPLTTLKSFADVLQRRHVRPQLEVLENHSELRTDLVDLLLGGRLPADGSFAIAQ